MNNTKLFFEHRQQVDGIAGVSTRTIDFEYRLADGHIYCLDCVNKPAWCVHMLPAFKDRAEAEMLWEGYDDSPASNLVLAVPMYPTGSLWTQVTIEADPFGIDELPRRVIWDDDVNRVPDAHGRDLTLLQKGEGVLAIREQLFQLMFLDLNFDQFHKGSDWKFECGSSSHSIQAETNWQDNMQNAIKGAEQWSVYTTGACLWCNNHDPSKDPDLIPENQSGFPSRV